MKKPHMNTCIFALLLAAINLSVNAGNGSCFGNRGRNVVRQDTVRLPAISPIRLPPQPQTFAAITITKPSPCATAESVTARDDESPTAAARASSSSKTVRIAELPNLDDTESPPDPGTFEVENSFARVQQTVAPRRGILKHSGGAGATVLPVDVSPCDSAVFFPHEKFIEDDWINTLTAAEKWSTRSCESEVNASCDSSDTSEGPRAQPVYHQVRRGPGEVGSLYAKPGKTTHYEDEWLATRAKILAVSTGVFEFRAAITYLVEPLWEKYTTLGWAPPWKVKQICKTIKYIDEQYHQLFTYYLQLLIKATSLKMGRQWVRNLSHTSPAPELVEKLHIYNILVGLKSVQCRKCSCTHTKLKPPYACCKRSLINMRHKDQVDAIITLNQINFVADFLLQKTTSLLRELVKSTNELEL